MAKGKKTGGRQKGTPNRVTADVREAFALIAKRNALRAEEWLLSIENPEKRLALFLDLCEYHVPRIARIEHTGENGGPMENVVTLAFKEPADQR